MAKSTINLAKIKTMTIFEFAKLKPSQKEEIIHTKAMLIENYVEKDVMITLYYLPSFFIEVNTCMKKNVVLDIIPYHRGFKIEQLSDKIYYNLNRLLLVAC